jgi:hypothetical protein
MFSTPDDRLLNRGLLTESTTSNNNNNIIHNRNNSLGMFNRTNQDHRLLGQQLLLRGPGALDRRMDVGHVESHITNEIVQLRRPEWSDHQDPLQLDIWARPTGYMQW